MQNNVFLRLAQERYTTKHYNGQQIPREEFDTLLEILRLTPTSQRPKSRLTRDELFTSLD